MPGQPAAGPSRLPHLDQPFRSPPRSRSFSSLLKGKENTSIDSNHLSPVSPTSSSSMRRAASYEDAAGQSSEAIPPPPPPKDFSGIPPTDPLSRAARVKMSSQDQQAMRKLRSHMVELSDEGTSRSASASTSASTSNSPDGPLLLGSTTPGTSHQLRSRRSTLSKLVLPDEETSSANPVLAPAQYHIAIIGHPGVGKTTLLNRAFRSWGVSPPSQAALNATQNVTTYRSEVKPGGKLKLSCECELLELALTSLNVETKGGELFPTGLPGISGAVVCYDAGSRGSMHLIPETIHRLVAAGIPTIMYACRSDPGAALQVEASHANSIGEAYNVGLIEVTDTTSEGRSKMRNGMRWLLFKMEQKLVRSRRKGSGSPGSAPTGLSADSDGGSGGDHIMWPAKFGMTPGSAPESKRGSMTSDARSSSSDLQWIVQGSGNTASLLDTLALSVGATPNGEVKAKTDANDNTMWIGLQDLFNQLFSKIVSSADDQFVVSFFMTYRRFCQPREVMAHFLDRYKRIEGYPVSQSSKNWTLQRLTGALIDWTTDYPGDLADIVTQNLFRQILDVLLKHNFMAHLTVTLAEVEAKLPGLVDLDVSWALKLSDSTVSLKSTQNELFADDGVLYDLESPLDKSEVASTPLTKEHSASIRTGSTTSLSLDRLRNPSGSLGVASHQDDRLVKPIDEAGSRWSGALGFVLNTDPKVFAAELTKRQWQLFAAIRPRDIFRHDFGKEKNDPVGDAIAFFNHLSRWVSTVILADPKAKYRARAYERFMMIAHELRRLNNYDSLYALMSGMQETSIHRLGQTHALVQPPLDVSKNFQSHSKLMDARGNYTHYQRALRADIDAGRSAIPLITILLSLVAKMQSVRKEDIRPDGMVQWDKFMRFGEILAIIPKCQARGAIVLGQPSKAFMTILHNVPVIHDEDGLFERSRMLEPPGATLQQPNVLKRFGKLAMA